MAPPSAATAAPARRHAAAGASPSRRWGRGSGAATPQTRRAPLRVVSDRARSGTRVGRVASGRLLNILSVSIVVAALLAVVVAQAFLANGQVRLSALQHDLTFEQAAHRQAELAVAQLETPSRIVAAASGEGMVRPAGVVELPYVSLSVPLPTPKVTPAPAPAPAPASTTGTGTASASATTATSGSGSGAASSGAGASGTASAGASGSISTTTATSTP